MANSFDLKKQFKLHDNALLKRFFADVPGMSEIDWDARQAHDVEPIAVAWGKLEASLRQGLQVVLQDVNELNDERGRRVLTEELQKRFPERIDEFRQQKNSLDAALWAHLETPTAFDEASLFASVEAQRTGRSANRWDGLPQKAIVVTDDVTVLLAAEVRRYYWEKELRGDRCVVNHYTRANGAEFFFVYLRDWAQKSLFITDQGELTPREESRTFEVVFIYMPAEGALEIIATGGSVVQQALRRTFCAAVLGVKVPDADPYRDVYSLDRLLDPSFQFAIVSADRIETVTLRRIRVIPMIANPPFEYLEKKFPEKTSLAEIRRMISNGMKADGLSPALASVTQASIQMRFMSDGRKVGRSMTFDMSMPNSCNLASKPDDVRAIAERCIKRWRLINV
jgi:hypothetical protein